MKRAISVLKKRRRTSSASNDLPEEILVEILYRLRIKPLFRCKCVSKLLNSVISDPKFGLKYLQTSPSLCHLSALLDPPLRHGFAKKSKDLSHSDSTVLHTVDDAPPANLYVTFRPGHDYRIMASSDGLVIGLFWSTKFHICVFNPLTSQSVKLPALPRLPNYRPWACGLATRAPQRVGENQDSVTYKVVCIQFIGDSPRTPNSIKFAMIDIFSLDTGRWTRKERISWPAAVTLDSWWPQLLNYKGILHYFEWNTRTVVTYDPYDSPEGFGSIQLPVRSGRKAMNLIRLGLPDSLEVGEIEDCGDGDWRLCVWRLVDYDDKREWCLHNRCPISPQWNPSLLRDCSLLLAPDPLNAEFVCWLSKYKKKAIALNLTSAEKVCVDLFNVEKWGFNPNLVVPISLNPWSSPFHGEAARPLFTKFRKTARNSSSTAGFRKIISAWFPSYAK